MKLKVKRIGAGLYETTVAGVEYQIGRAEDPAPGYEWWAETEHQGAVDFAARTKASLLQQLIEHYGRKGD